MNSSHRRKSAFNLGAVAVQVGTAFINSMESKAIPSYKQLFENQPAATYLTSAFSGRWARGFRNELMDLIENSGTPTLPYPWQAVLTSNVRKLAEENNDKE